MRLTGPALAVVSPSAVQSSRSISLPSVDLDAYVAANRPHWERLEHLVSRRGRLDGEEADELVTLYQRVATHLSVVRSSAPDAVLVGRLSTLVARARSAVAGAHTPAWRDVSRFFL